MSIPSQGEANLGNPEEHFLPWLRNMPMIAGIGAVTHPGVLRAWSKHLWECGNVSRDYLLSLADEDGNINISQLPEQLKKLQRPIRGPYDTYNNAAQWVSTDKPDPKPFVVQDTRHMTIQEQYAVRDMLIETGVVQVPVQQPPLAEEFNESN
ncbi:phage gene 29 protein family protein [Mycobacteroides salmoniphilum]|uniref:phage gene 29 protein family protein n=1 Tax=Mycobacteroides salmoniphilum TaxID=404941 RepID=UPI0009940FC0|nr:DUF2744 domain-containing protein [Mycobacteroides salmoniphilum]